MWSSILIVILVFAVLGILLGFSEASGQLASHALQLDSTFQPILQVSS